jgi:GntR family transcriptional regulator
MHGARPLDRDRAEPLWSQLSADLLARMAAGEFAAEFPVERDLVASYGVSRHTVRAALRRLRERGLVEAGRGRRPRLAGAGEITQPLGALYSLFASVEAAGMAQRSTVRRLEVHADGIVARRLGLEESTPLLHLERLRLADEEPLALDRLWLPAAVAGPLVTSDFTHTGFYEELAARTGVRLASGREQLRAVVPAAAEAASLDLPAGVAALSIDRLGCTTHGPIEWRHSVVRGDRFSVVAEFSAREGYRLASPSLRLAAG